MKKLLLLLLLSTGAWAQGVRVTTSYEFEAFKDSLRKAGSVTPITPDCERGPSLKEIQAVTESSVKFLFDGAGIRSMTIRVTGMLDTISIRSTTVYPVNNTPTALFKALPTGLYRFWIIAQTRTSDGAPCKNKATPTPLPFVVGSTGGISPPSSTSYGAYKFTLDGRVVTQSKSDRIDLSFAGGNVSDATAGIDQSGEITRVNGKNRFYLVNLKYFEGDSSAYAKLSNIYLTDGLYSVAAYDFDPSVMPDYAKFKTQISGDPKDFVPGKVTISFIQFTIRTPGKETYSAVPAWLEVSRISIWENFAVKKDWNKYNKWVAVGKINNNTSLDFYHEKGALTDLNLGGHPYTYIVAKANGQNADYRRMGYDMVNAMGGTTRAALWAEFSENGIPGKETDFYQGVKDRFFELGVSDVRKMGSPGEYGIENYYKYFTGDKWSNETDYKKSLTTNVYDIYQPGGNGWVGKYDYFNAGVEVRNLNIKNYYPWRPQSVALNLIYCNEIGTIATRKLGMDRGLQFITMPWEEDFSNMGLKTNEIIPFKNGELLVKGGWVGAEWSTAFEIGFYSTLIIDGFTQWDAPRSKYGIDTTMISGDQEKYWRKTGAKDWTKYEPSKDGAPSNDYAGLSPDLSACAINASMAGAEAVYDIIDRIDESISMAAYKSSLGDFTPEPGTAGLNLNGHGPLNEKSFSLYKAKTGTGSLALLGKGKSGKRVFIFQSGLSAHRFERVTFENVSFDAYGGQISIVKL